MMMMKAKQASLVDLSLLARTRAVTVRKEVPHQWEVAVA
jgi:hypothetical protein